MVRILHQESGKLFRRCFHTQYNGSRLRAVGGNPQKDMLSHFLRRPPEKIFTQRRIVSEACGPSERLPCCVFAIQQSEDVSASGPVRLIVVCSAGRNLFESRESCSLPPGLSECHGSANERANARRNPDETFIEQENLRPVDHSSSRATGMDGLNRRLQLIPSRLVEG